MNKLSLNTKSDPLKLGVYVHIPYCGFMCHYCDFAKTARWDQEAVRSYFKMLESHSRLWMSLLHEKFPGLLISSLNFGGGTPSLFSFEYQPLLEIFRDFLTSDCEISLEANPDDLKPEKLKSWKDTGFNRLSVGIQSFQDHGLNFLKRTHSRKHALSGLLQARHFFENVNVDLIYSWPGQTHHLWESDLRTATESGAAHLSLYNLTYAPGTPVGRARQRGKIKEEPEEKQSEFYLLAKETLGSSGWIHDEVSNWSRPGFSCRHNWIYWQGGPYLGVGAGAHGYLPLHSTTGLRYNYPGSELICRRKHPEILTEIKNLMEKDPSLQENTGNILHTEHRDQESWLLEYLGSALRSRKGIDLNLIKAITGKAFKTDSWIEEQADKKALTIRGHQLILSSDEWFRETAWSLRLSENFH